MTDRTSNEHVGAKRYKLTTGHSDDAGLGGEGWVVRMSDHFPSFDTAQKWVKSEDYEALRQRFEKACQRVTELESSRDETSDHLSDDVACVLTDACMILDVVKGEWAEAWSEWDQGVRDRITRLLIANHEARPGSKETRRLGLAAQIDAAKKRIAAWPADVRAALGLPEEPRRDDPNAPFRWICPKCTTVNGIADEVCLGGSCGTKRPEKAREHHPRCELMQPHGHEPPKCTCSGLNGD